MVSKIQKLEVNIPNLKVNIFLRYSLRSLDI